MKKYSHIHKYERRELGKFTVFKCAVPGCVHYVRKILAENRITICWRCGEAFVLTKFALRYRRPHCTDCIKTKKKVTYDRLKELLESSDMLSKVRS